MFKSENLIKKPDFVFNINLNKNNNKKKYNYNNLAIRKMK